MLENMRGTHTNKRLQGKICITWCTGSKLLERNKFRDTRMTVTYRDSWRCLSQAFCQLRNSIPINGTVSLKVCTANSHWLTSIPSETFSTGTPQRSLQKSISVFISDVRPPEKFIRLNYTNRASSLHYSYYVRNSHT